MEAHDERELEAALTTEARLIGLNNRNLRTLEVDPDNCLRLRELVPNDRLVVGESGVREPRTLVAWRALGIDAALVGEALMRAADPASAARAFVNAGRMPDDVAAADRMPLVKICGVTDSEGVLAAVTGRRRCHRAEPGSGHAPLPEPRRGHVPRGRGSWRRAGRSAAAHRGRLRRRAGAGHRSGHLRLQSRRGAALRPRIARLHRGHSTARLEGPPSPRPPTAWIPQRSRSASGNRRSDAASRCRSPSRQPTSTSAPAPHGSFSTPPEARSPEGPAVRSPARSRPAVAREVPVILAGGLDARNVAGRGPRSTRHRRGRRAAVWRSSPLSATPALAAARRPAPWLPSVRGRARIRCRWRLFVKRARAARFDRPHVRVRPTPVPEPLLEPDEHGQVGARTATSVAGTCPRRSSRRWTSSRPRGSETRHDPRFWAELRELQHHYGGRPTPIYRADRLGVGDARGRPPEMAGGRLRASGRRRDGALPERIHLYLKREDLNHTGAHKLNNALGQVLLTRRLGKSRVIAETGAGMHGVATATACALLDIPCVVHMGVEDIARQAPNVLRMEALGAEVRPVHGGSGTLKDAVSEALRDWVTNVETLALLPRLDDGPASVPDDRPRLPAGDRRRGRGADRSMPKGGCRTWRSPASAAARTRSACSTASSASRRFDWPRPRRRGRGSRPVRHAAALLGGTPGILHGSRSYMLQDADGQVVEAVSISAGLDYPGIGPQLAALMEAGRLHVSSATDSEAIAAVRQVARTEGILAAVESAHAVAALPDVLAALARDAGNDAAASRNGDRPRPLRSRRQGPCGVGRRPKPGGVAPKAKAGPLLRTRMAARTACARQAMQSQHRRCTSPIERRRRLDERSQGQIGRPRAWCGRANPNRCGRNQPGVRARRPRPRLAALSARGGSRPLSPLPRPRTARPSFRT